MVILPSPSAGKCITPPSLRLKVPHNGAPRIWPPSFSRWKRDHVEITGEALRHLVAEVLDQFCIPELESHDHGDAQHLRIGSAPS